MVCEILLRDVAHDLALLRVIFLFKTHAVPSLIEELAIRPDLLLKLILKGVYLLLEGIHEEGGRLLLQRTPLHLLR